MTKYLIFGNGFIGNKFLNYLQDSTMVKEKVYSINDIYLHIQRHSPEVIIDCIGKTGKPNLDWCEEHKEETFFSNVTIPTFIAEVCKEKKLYMVHIGSGSIYEGNNIFSENDMANSKNSFYSMTKRYSEQILTHYDNILQLRIHMSIDDKPCPKNLITKLTSFKYIINIPNSIICMPDLMKIADELINRKETGIFNVVNKGSITHKEILEMYQYIVDPKFKMPVTVSQENLGTLVPRSGSILNTEKLERIGIKIRDIREAIKECMEEYVKWI